MPGSMMAVWGGRKSFHWEFSDLGSVLVLALSVCLPFGQATSPFGGPHLGFSEVESRKDEINDVQ